jgi:hypothetical protein
VLNFQQGAGGYTGTQDTMVRSNETGSGAGQSGNGDSRGRNFGSLDFLSIDRDDGSPGSKPNQGLIRFDSVFGSSAGQVRSGDSIESAMLSLTVFDVGSGFTVHDMLVDWSQGTATWNSLVGGVNANGSDAAAAALASFGANNSSANVTAGTLTIDVTASLRAVQAGALPGFGWALLPYAAGTNGVDLRSAEFSVLADRPLLSVTVTPVPEPGTLLMGSLGALTLLGVMARRRR